MIKADRVTLADNTVLVAPQGAVARKPGARRVSRRTLTGRVVAVGKITKDQRDRGCIKLGPGDQIVYHNWGRNILVQLQGERCELIRVDAVEMSFVPAIATLKARKKRRAA